MSRRLRLAAAALVALAVLAGCDGDPPSQTTPTSTAPGTSPTTTSNAPSAPAPAVKQSLDATPFLADPCRSLTESQRQALTLAGGSIDPGRPGKACNFSTADKQIVVTVTFDANSVTRIGELTRGLGSVYQQHLSGVWEYWEPMELDGYPAVSYEASLAKTKLSCEVAVGVSNSSFFDVRYVFWSGEPGEKNSCAEGRAVASAVLSTIKAGR